MPDQIVSVRMPRTLHEELRSLAEENHYLDVSEEIRSLLRNKWLSHKDPYSMKLMAIREKAAKARVPDKLKLLEQDLKKLLEEINELK